MSPISEAMVSNGVVLDQSVPGGAMPTASGLSQNGGTYIFQTAGGPVGGMIHTTTGVPLVPAGGGVPGAPPQGPPQPPPPHQPTSATAPRAHRGGGPAAGGLHQPGAHRAHSPHRYSPNGGGPQSRGNSPQNQQSAAAAAAAAAAGPNQQHVVLVHVNPGETFSVRVGDQIQHIQGEQLISHVSRLFQNSFLAGCSKGKVDGLI